MFHSPSRVNPENQLADLLLACSFIGRDSTHFTMELSCGQVPFQILSDANQISQAIHRKPLIARDQMEEWGRDPNFQRKITQQNRIYLRTDVNEVTQSDKVTEVEIVAIAHALYYLDYKKDIFGGSMIRMQDFALINCSDGLRAVPTNDLDSCRFKYNDIYWAVESDPWGK